MLFFGFRKKNKKEVTELTKDEKEIKKARDDIKETGEDSQTEKDRIDESVGEQEELSGDKDSQDAKDRVDESEGTEKADEEREEEKKEDKNEEKMPKWAERIVSALDRLEARLATDAEKTVKTADEEAAERIDKAFGVGNGIFQGEQKEEPAKKMTPKEVAEILRKIN